MSTEWSIVVRTVPAREIKRRGIGAVDEALTEGPVHVIKDDQPAYVVMSENQYKELMDDQHEAHVARLRVALDDVEAGRVRKVSAQTLIDEYDLEA